MAEGSAIGPSKMKRRRPRLMLSVIALILVMIIVVFYFAPAIIHSLRPFPSERTVLSTSAGGVIWSHDEEYSMVGGLEYVFSNMYIHVAYPTEGSTFDDSRVYARGNFNVSKVVFGDFGSFSYSAANSCPVTGEETNQGLVWRTFWLMINDSDSDSRWSRGDSLAIFSGLTLNGTVSEEGFLEDTEYAITVVFMPPPGSQGGRVFTEYHFAFHDGRFFSWSPDEMFYHDW